MREQTQLWRSELAELAELENHRLRLAAKGEVTRQLNSRLSSSRLSFRQGCDSTARLVTQSAQHCLCLMLVCEYPAIVRRTVGVTQKRAEINAATGADFTGITAIDGVAHRSCGLPSSLRRQVGLAVYAYAPATGGPPATGGKQALG